MKKDLFGWIQEFPYDEPRDIQYDIINELLKNIFLSEEKFKVVSAPTGSGKSGIAVTVARYLTDYYRSLGNIKSCYARDFHKELPLASSKTLILTPTLILQDQYAKDFEGSEGVFVLKGRNNYECGAALELKKILKKKMTGAGTREEQLFLKKKIMADACILNGGTEVPKSISSDFFNYLKKEKCSVNNCQYREAKRKAVDSSVVILNFYAYLYHAMNRTFRNVQNIIIDEAHKIEKNLLDFGKFNVNYGKIFGILENIFTSVPEIPTTENIKEHTECIRLLVNSNFITATAILKSSISKMTDETALILAKEEMEYLDKKLNFLQFLLENLVEYENNWIISKESKTTYSFQPIMADKLMLDLISNQTNTVTLMSATINKKQVALNFSLKEEDIHEIKSDPLIKLSYRPIVLFGNTKTNMKFANKVAALPLQAKVICFLLSNVHTKQRGIIHTHTIQNAKKLKEYVEQHMGKSFCDRFIWHLGGKKGTYIDKFIKTSSIQDDNKILVSPSLVEGFDGKDKIARYQIIMKVPYPYRKDAVVDAKLSRFGDDWYLLDTATELTQMYGRINRHEKDLGVTYVLDGGISTFYQMLKAKGLVDAISPLLSEALCHMNNFMFISDEGGFLPFPFHINSKRVETDIDKAIASSRLLEDILSP